MILPYNPNVDERTFRSIVRDIVRVLESSDIDVAIYRPEQLGLILYFKDSNKIEKTLSLLDVLINERGYPCDCLKQQSEVLILKFEEREFLGGAHEV